MSDEQRTGPGRRLDDGQVGGDHYKKLKITPWEALEAWLTPEEFQGYLKGEAIVYIAREAAKAGATDIGKARHTLQKLEQVYQPAVPTARPPVDNRDPATLSAAELALIPLPPIRVEASLVPGYVFVNGHVYDLHSSRQVTKACTVPEVCAQNRSCAKPGSGCAWDRTAGRPVAPAPTPAAPAGSSPAAG